METVVRDLAHSSEGYDTTVLCFASEEALKTTSKEPFKVYRSPVTLSLASQDISLDYLISGIRLIGRSEIVHVHLPNFWAILVVLLSARRKLIIHWHADVVGKGLLYRLLKPLEKWIINHADVILCTSRSYAEASGPLRGSAGKIRVLPIGIPSNGDSKIAIAAGPTRILAIGRLESYKNYGLLIQVMEHLPDSVVLDIVGTGSLQDTLEHQIREQGLTERVILRGSVSDAELTDLFAAAKVHVLASVTRAEAFGVVLLEAMRQGVPSVCFDIQGSGVAEVNENDVSGLVVQDQTPFAFANAVERIVNDANLHKRLSEGAKTRFATQFTLQSVAEQYKNILKSL